MTVVTLTRAGDRYTVEAEGHAANVRDDGSVEGDRQVCAAVSVLLQTLHTWLVWSRADVAEARIGSGDSRLCFSGRGSDTAFDFVYCGFRRLAETNPDCIQYKLFVQHGTGARSR